MEFFPKGYAMPARPSRYMQRKEGDNQFRVLSSAIIGWQWFEASSEGSVPTRVRSKDEVPPERINAGDGREPAKHFWAFVVWNHDVGMVQILALTQTTIMRPMKRIVDSWGDPKSYDMVISRESTGTHKMDVEYSVLPIPAEQSKEVPESAWEEAKKVDLEALYRNEDPFGGEITETDLEKAFDEM